MQTNQEPDQEPLVYDFAEPVAFDAQNQVIRCGPIPNCRPLPCFVSYGSLNPSVTSCWRLSPAALAEVARTGVVYVNTAGEVPPPIYVDGLPPFNDSDRRVAQDLIDAGIVQGQTMEAAVALDAWDLARAQNVQTRGRGGASSFDENGALIQQAVQRLGRELIDAIDDDQAGSSSDQRTASYYPNQYVELLGKTALAFFTAYPELYTPAIVAQMVAFGGDDPLFIRKLGPELLDAMSQYMNRPTDDDDND